MDRPIRIVFQSRVARATQRWLWVRDWQDSSAGIWTTSYPGSQSSLLPRLNRDPGIGWSRDPSYFGGFAQLFLGKG